MSGNQAVSEAEIITVACYQQFGWFNKTPVVSHGSCFRDKQVIVIFQDSSDISSVKSNKFTVPESPAEDLSYSGEHVSVLSKLQFLKGLSYSSFL